MRWDRARRSNNVVDARGRGGIAAGGLGIGGLLLFVAIALLTGEEPTEVLEQLGSELAVSPSASEVPVGDDPQVDFVRAILGDTEDTWRALFAAGNLDYSDPRLVLFRGGVRSACGMASSASGPFYCPADQQVYLDLDFFGEMARRFRAGGDFAQAYVIAHEVGHHVQTLMGVTGHVHSARQQGVRVEGAEGLLVRQELQADCLAGVWAHHAQQRHDWLEPGDLEEALTAASAIGDDRLQQATQGQVVPDAFTHGTSEQRVHWFRTGFESGNPEQCDTFTTATL